MSVDWTGLCDRRGSMAEEAATAGDPGLRRQADHRDRPRRHDTIIGTSHPDVIVAGDGDDTVKPGKGKDIVCGRAATTR